MKKMLTLFSMLCFAWTMGAANYYVAGNGTSGNPWCDGKSWVINGSAMTMNGTVGTITFSAVPAGSYQFKVTNGTNAWYGVNKFSNSCSNLYAYGTDNICFNTQASQDITITYDGTTICLSGTVGNDHPDPTQIGVAGVPAEYEGVMMQCFYWNSYNDKGYGRTKWIDLIPQAEDIGNNFDLVWFPPSGYGGGTGYYTKRYSLQDSDWGSKNKLIELIGLLHAKGTKVVADVVVNHKQASSGWCSFSNENFGTYGQFQLTSEHICSGDECFKDSDSNCKGGQGGAADTGDNDAGCRDLDHTSTYVQDMVKAYLNWMRNDLGYDGWRYDMVKGYLGSYVSMYNISSQPFFSVGEYWDGTPNNLKGYLETAAYNTTVFDFALKYKLNSTIAKNNYTGLKNAGMRGIGLQKYSVTFIDNHDTFERDDNKADEFITYKATLKNNKPKVMQANAYILMMPGIPCVFYPHWVTFKSDINSLIALRKAVGIHSESQVSDESASTSAYSATIAGHNGSAILRMGTGRDMTVPAGYFLAVSGDKFEIYASNGVVFTPVNITALEDIQAEPNNSDKQLINGHLYIRKNGHTFDATGRLIR